MVSFLNKAELFMLLKIFVIFPSKKSNVLLEEAETFQFLPCAMLNHDT